jgi:hypothetical protein
MTSRSAVTGVLLVGAALLGAGPGRAEDPAAQAARRGAVVVAVGDEAGPAARALAREVYRDERLRPRIDDPTARVLAGDAPGPDAPASLTDLGRARAGLVVPVSEDDATYRRVLAGIGAELGAELVVPVEVRGGRTSARALRVEGASFAGVEVSATVSGEPAGAPIQWANAPAVLRALLPADRPVEAKPAGPRAGALAPTAKPGPPPRARRPAEPPSKSMFSSPFFWGSLGAVAAVGIGIFVAARVSDDADDTFLVQGSVPR